MKILDYLIKENIPFHSLKYYKQAFTHSSYANEAQNKLEDYERLEFMGDAVLQLFVSEYLFKSYPDYPEGELTTLRSKLVREESLAKFARELRLEELIYLGVGEEKSGGRDRDSVLCDIFESFVGALYLDCGKKEVIKILHKTIFKHVDDVFHSEDRRSVTYKLIAETGPANAPEFTINVTLDGMVLGTGKGTSKKKAEQQSAKDALLKVAKTKEKD